MSRRVKIPYHIPGGASGFLLMDVDTASGVSMPTNATSASSASSGTLQAWQKTVAGSYSFVVPNDCSVIQVSATGGGGSGGGGSSSAAAAGGGGGPAPQHRRVTVAVTPGSTITCVVGAGGAAPAAAADGNDGGETYISGAGIVSPFKDGSNNIRFGYGLKGKLGSGTTGGDGGGAMMASTADAVYGTLNTGTAHASRWWYVDGQEIVDIQMPICQGAGGGGNTSVNGGSRASAGFAGLNGRGLGLSGAGGATWGGGGAGGGGGYARGGNGGATAGGAGSIGSGPGAGGGGGAGNTGGTGGAGGAGTDGAIEILYVSSSTVA